MSSPYQREEHRESETVDDLMLRADVPNESDDDSRTASSVRDIASRIPESLSAIGRDISRTIERAMSAKDDYVVAVKISPEAQDKLEQLVQAGVFRNRAEAAGFLIDEGIRTQAALFGRVEQKLAEIEGMLRSSWYDVINLDFIRYPVHWEVPNPRIPDTCYCAV